MYYSMSYGPILSYVIITEWTNICEVLEVPTNLVPYLADIDIDSYCQDKDRVSFPGLMHLILASLPLRVTI